MDNKLNWEQIFHEISQKEYFKNLLFFIDDEYKNYPCCPKKEEIFKAFELVDFNKIKVVIIGQDPYINENEAMGLAFSINKGNKLPPSLINIYKEIELEFHLKMDFSDGDLTYLANQGVLLLNAYLSTRLHQSLAHNKKEYQLLFIDILKYIEQNDSPIVYLLWGSFAKKYKKYITNKNHLVLESNHPSPLSANRGGWFNNNHFIQCNEYLKNKGQEIIYWTNTNKNI
ncbi:MAG: uracil-DNA glycosylase [Bacilli bacterium]